MTTIPEGWVTGYHFLKADMRSGEGNETPWQDGETRTYEGRVAICDSGYHWCRDWFDCLQYAPGPIACFVAAPPPVEEHGDKCVSQSRLLVAHQNVEKQLRLFACLCAERALQRERDAGREPDPRSWQAIAVARRYAVGEATEEELTSAEDAAWAAWAAARAAARAAEDAAWAARAAAWAAARAAAEAAEREWQRQKFNAMMSAAFEEVPA